MPTAAQLAACQADPVRILRLMGKTPLPWQEAFLRSDEDTILNIHRKGAKSFTVGVKVTHRTQFKENQLAVIVCPSRNQSQETMRFCLDAYYALGQPVPIVRASEQRVEFANGSRIISLPGVERTIRTYGPQLIVIDEAARVPDNVYEAVRPMRAHSKGQLILPSTPAGQRGFFYHEAMRSLQETADGKRPDFRYIVQTADRTPWITKEFLEREERSRGRDFVQQEYFCSFTHVSGLIYPDFDKCLVESVPHLRGRLVGGIDWGWTDPFAALWGIHEIETDTLWIIGERYLGECMPQAHAASLKAKGDYEWVADPHQPTSIREFRAAGLTIRPARVYGGRGVDSEIEKVRIPLVTQRIQTGRLKVWRSRCPNLIKESQMYAREPEEDARGHRPPIDGWNHAFDALGYLVTHIDRGQIAKLRSRVGEAEYVPPPADPQPVDKKHVYELAAAERASWEQQAVDNPDFWVGDDD
jgi:hypothetical protein